MTAERPVTSADREAALAAEAATELPPRPFDADAGYRDFLRNARTGFKGGDMPKHYPFDIVRPSELAGKPVPPRLWVVKDWIPLGTTTALYGDGGTGKSLAALGLQTSCATGLPWLGLPTAKCRSFGFYCEDEEAELHRRQADINRALGIDWRDLDGMTYASRAGEDNILMRFDAGGYGETTAVFDDLLDTCLDLEVRLAIIDTAADVFGGNENVRAQVRQFITGCLGKLAQKIRGAVLLLAHPSRSGMASGEGDGASTAWNASVRSRLYLSRPPVEGDEAPDDNRRVLTRKKANYAGIGDSVELRWTDGYFTVERQAVGVFAGIERHHGEAAFLDALDEAERRGIPVSHSSNASNFAPKVLREMPQAAKLTRGDLRRAMQSLFDQHKIKVVEFGPPSNPRHRLARA